MKVLCLVLPALLLVTAAFAGFSEEPQFGVRVTNTLAWGDYDGDGDLDLAVGNTTQNYLYRNNGNGTFSELARFGNTNTRAMAWADYDNDGDLDIAVGNDGSACYVYENTGGGNFTAHAWGFPTSDPVNSVSWGDYDIDGDLDLAFGCSSGTSNLLFSNNNGTDFTLFRMFGVAADETYGVYWGDFNDDNLPDIVAANVGQNYYFENEGSPVYIPGTGQSEFGGNVDFNHTAAIGDCDNYYHDIRYSLDLAIGGFAVRSKLFSGDGTGAFAEVPDQPLGDFTDNVVTINWGDHNNDGWLDLIAGNNLSDIPNILYENEGGGSSFTTYEYFGAYAANAMAWGDYDGDGDLDVALGCPDGQNYLYINDENSDQYLIIRPVGDAALETNVSGVGAKVWVYQAGHMYEPASFVGYREVAANCSDGQNPLEVHVARPGIDYYDVIIRWPTDAGKFFVEEYWANIAGGQTIDLVEGTGTPTGIDDGEDGSPNTPTGFYLYPAVPNPSDGPTVINFVLPYKCEINLELFDVKGRKIRDVAQGEYDAGKYEETVSGLSSGIYLYRFTAGEFSDVKKMVVE